MSCFGETWPDAQPFRVGVIGCGRISDIYLQNCARFPELDVVACASLDAAESAAKASQYGIPKSCSPAELLADPSIDVVLNLTIPAAHADIARRALDAGKHVYGEKPLATTMADAEDLLARAEAAGLLLGSAPDTFLGGRWQTVRHLIDKGAIGAPTGVFAHVGTHGTERHHPNPDFYYAKGGGPLLDLGPYYLTAMVFCLGPIACVAGLGRRTFAQRQIENGPRNGTWMPVDVNTHTLSLLEFESGVIGDMTMSFDIWDSEAPRLEIYGEDGTICIPDPDPVHGANVFGGPVWLRTKETARWTHQPRPEGRGDWQVIDGPFGHTDNCRGLGLLDLAYAARLNRAPRASGALAYHVFEVLDALERASENRSFQEISSRPARPEPLRPMSEAQRDTAYAV